MKNIINELPISRPLFRFNDSRRSSASLSTNTNWTVMTRTTTACVYDTRLDNEL